MLTVNERQKLIGIIADLYDFTDGGPRARRILIEQAGLHRFRRMDLSGSPLEVAGDLVIRLENFGYLPEQPIYHALGALLSYVLTLRDLPQDNASFLAGLIVRYSLIRDPTYVDNLRVEYRIAEMTIRSATPVVSSPTMAANIEIPPFNIAIFDESGLEGIINSEDNFIDIYSLFGAIYSAQAVCRIDDLAGKAIGTGFLIGPDLLLTNQHILKNKNYLSDALAHFDYRNDVKGVLQEGRIFKFQPDFYYSSDASALDYALVRLKGSPLEQVALKSITDYQSYLDLVLQGKHRGYLVLAERFIKEYDRLNIIQHPDGKPMKVVLTQNYVVKDMTQARVQYVADTMDGSSGSPIFNQIWEVVALHHSGKPYPPDSIQEVMQKAWKGHFRVNEGIPIRAILEDFRAKGLVQYLPNS